MRYTKKKPSNEIYKLWFDFLRLADPAKCAENVLRDFGDVWNTDFATWWKDHHHLFEPMTPLTFEFIQTADEFRDFEGSDDLMIIAVPLLAPKAQLRKDFEKLLREYHPGRKGRPKFDDFAEEYSLHSRPYVHSLKQILRVYRYKMAHPSVPAPTIEKNLRLITKSGPKAGKIWAVGNTPKELERMRNIQASTVSRYLRQADKLIENVSQGRFPVTK